jgi:hypothetical protein
LAAPSKGRHEALVIVVSVAVVLGMAVATLFLLLWKARPLLVVSGAGMHVAVALCPPFMLVPIIGAVNASPLENVILGATVVLGNGSLYAGLASFAYWTMVTFVPKRPH